MVILAGKEQEMKNLLAKVERYLERIGVERGKDERDKI